MALTGVSMSIHRPAVESADPVVLSASHAYVLEVIKLRALSFDDLMQEIDDLEPLWIDLRVVSEV